MLARCDAYYYRHSRNISKQGKDGSIKVGDAEMMVEGWNRGMIFY